MNDQDLKSLLAALEERVVTVLPPNWRAGRRCPECGVESTIEKCPKGKTVFCSRLDPEEYEPTPFIEKQDWICQEAAELIRVLGAKAKEFSRLCLNLLAKKKESDEKIVKILTFCHLRIERHRKNIEQFGLDSKMGEWSSLEVKEAELFYRVILGIVRTKQVIPFTFLNKRIEKDNIKGLGENF